MATTQLFANTLDQALQGNIKWKSGGDAINMALLSSAPNMDSAVHYSDLAGEVAAGGGYSTGGQSIGTPLHTVYPADVAPGSGGWPNSWTAGHAYAAQDIVVPQTLNGFCYRCVIAGTSGTSQPAFDSVEGKQYADSNTSPPTGVTNPQWANAGKSVTVYTSAAVAWASSTITASLACIYDVTSGALICLITFTTSLSSANTTFQVSPDATNGWFAFTPW